MGWRRQQNETGDTVRMIKRESQRQRAAPGMTDQHGALDRKSVQQFAQDRRLVGRRSTLPRRPLAPALARPIDENDALPRRKRLAERKPHVFEIAAGAMQENDRRLVRAGGRAAAQFDHVLALTVDIDEATA